MNTKIEEKLKAQRMIVNNLRGVESAVKNIVIVKDAFREKMEALTLHGMETYSQEYLEKVPDAQGEMAVIRAAAGLPEKASSE